RDVELDDLDGAAHPGGGLAPATRVARAEEDAHPVAGEDGGEAAADAAAGSGDERGLHPKKLSAGPFGGAERRSPARNAHRPCRSHPKSPDVGNESSSASRSRSPAPCSRWSRSSPSGRTGPSTPLTPRSAPASSRRCWRAAATW